METTVLLSVDETLEALQKAGQIKYRFPARPQTLRLREPRQ